MNIEVQCDKSCDYRKHIPLKCLGIVRFESFIQQGWIKLIKSDNKDFCIVTKDF